MFRKLLKLRRIWLLLLLPLSFLLIAAARNIAGFADWYAPSVYLPLSYLLNRITSLVPFSVGEILLLLLILFLLFSLVLFVVHMIRQKESRGFRAVKFFLNLLCFLSVMLFSFTAFAGINYSRTPYSEAHSLTIEKSTNEELYTLCVYLAEELNEVRPLVKEDENGNMMLSLSIEETAQNAASWANGMEDGGFRGQYGSPKPVLLSRLMSYAGITGIFSPFTLEANVNVDVPDYSIPSTMCHELSHLRGYMREDEANFVAYLICRQSSDPDFQYSGLMLAFVYSNNALYSSDSSLGSKSFALLSEKVKNDFYANSAYWQQFEGPVKETAQKTNDVYLKANDQEDGVKSYGRMVDLLLADYRKNIAE